MWGGGYTGFSRHQSGWQSSKMYGLLVECCVSNSSHSFQVT